ncbi:MAG: hypothetical protein RQ724_08725, partial [Desulfuromonadales bacterium]|nr:hypothetical protein [Desulfuromonadales bacterium]
QHQQKRRPDPATENAFFNFLNLLFNTSDHSRPRVSMPVKLPHAPGTINRYQYHRLALEKKSRPVVVFAGKTFCFREYDQ